MAAALNVTNTDISKVLAEVYKGFRRNIFPILPLKAPTGPYHVDEVRNYAQTAGLYRACTYCGYSLREHEWKAHYAVHALQGTTEVRYVGWVWGRSE